jgi:hypothetical protein
MLRPAGERAGAPDEPVAVAPVAVAQDAGGLAPAEPQTPPSPLLPPNAVRPPSSPGPEVVGPRPDDPHLPGMLPHPMDEAHARIDAENRLLQRLNDAMSFRDVGQMHALLAEYRKLDPADKDASQAGYTVVADCIEHPGEGSLAAAHQFYDTQRHSPLRRYVRRICFERTN